MTDHVGRFLEEIKEMQISRLDKEERAMNLLIAGIITGEEHAEFIRELRE